MQEQLEISLESLFTTTPDARVATALRASSRVHVEAGDKDVVLDRFPSAGASCAALRVCGPPSVRLTAAGCRSVEIVEGGGWLLSTHDGAEYWIPLLPGLNRLEPLGRILGNCPADVIDMNLSGERWSLALDLPPAHVLDCVIWRLPSQIAEELRVLSPLERQGLFLWGSHTLYAGPADVYRHLVHGLVYENRYEWPKRWKICSENDAHALFTCCAGLARATGKALYGLLATQLLHAVLARQGDDGGYHHGTWTNELESHYRLHASAMHMMMDALDERDDSTIRTALDRAMAYAAAQTDQTAFGKWFLHDELEHSAAGMERGPFKWIPSRALGKSPTNMLVLNTHLDTLVAALRHADVTGSERYRTLNESARGSALAILGCRPAESLYRIVFWLVGLTCLSTPKAASLPLPLRALKRVAWQYIIPRLPALKTRLPRLVMPGGYVDRALSLKNWSHRYLSTNAMDLARIARRLPGDVMFRDVLKEALHYAIDSGLAEKWREQPADQYSIGFLAEALCHACTLDGAYEWRQLLATQLFALHDLGLGFPPTALGCNPEIVPWAQHAPCPLPAEDAIRVASLAGPQGREVLVLNTGSSPAVMTWLNPQPGAMQWRDADGIEQHPDAPLPPRAWRLGAAA